jgi:hypothetical protein
LKERKKKRKCVSFFLAVADVLHLHTKVVKEIRKKKTKNNRRVFLGKSFQTQKGEGRKQQKKKNI